MYQESGSRSNCDSEESQNKNVSRIEKSYGELTLRLENVRKMMKS